jgi:predicted dehydrogenase
MSGRVTRRGFLRTSAATGLAAVAAPCFIPSRAMGANDRIVLGGIGVGNQGGSLVRSFSRQCPIAAIADVYLPRAREVAAAVGAKDAYQDYRQLLERKDIDAVIVATPLRWHALNCIHAAQAGKDIYCEKPLTYSIAEGRRVVEAVRKHNRVLQTGSQQRSGSQEYTGCTYVRNGAIGRVTRVLASNYHSPMEPLHPAQEIPEGLDWDMWCGPAEKPPYNFVIWDNRSDPSWVSIRPFSGGEMTDWGSHGLDMAQWGLGMDESGPVEVWTEGEPFKSLASTPERPGGRHRGPRSPKVLMKYPGDIVMELDGGPGVSGVTFRGRTRNLDRHPRKFPLQSARTDRGAAERSEGRTVPQHQPFPELVGLHQGPPRPGGQRRDRSSLGHRLPSGQHRSLGERDHGPDRPEAGLGRGRRTLHEQRGSKPVPRPALPLPVSISGDGVRL